MAKQYEMKDMDTLDIWCGIECTFPPDTMILHQASYRKYFVRNWANHLVHTMKLLTHLSPLNANALTEILEDAAEHHDPCYNANP
jgi:hypothetical protein